MVYRNYNYKRKDLAIIVPSKDHFRTGLLLRRPVFAGVSGGLCVTASAAGGGGEIGGTSQDPNVALACSYTSNQITLGFRFKSLVPPFLSILDSAIAKSPDGLTCNLY